MENEFPIHPAANIFPMITGDDFEKLKADIAANGLKENILLLDGQILDGRNRYQACNELGIQVYWSEVESCDDPIAYVLSMNLHRRHLTPSQRAACAAKVAKLRNGEHGKKALQCCRASADEAAKVFGVSARSVGTAKHVADKGDRTVTEAVESGVITVAAAAKLVDAVPDKKEQRKIVSEGKKAVSDATKVVSETKKPKRSKAKPKQEKAGELDFSATMNAALAAALDKFAPHEVVVRAWLEQRLAELNH